MTSSWEPQQAQNRLTMSTKLSRQFNPC